MLDFVSYHSAISVTYVSSGIITHFELAFVHLHFALLNTKVLNSFEELYIMQAAAFNSFDNIYIYIYIYIDR